MRLPSHGVSHILAVAALVVLSLYLGRNRNQSECTAGTFQLPGMDGCHPWLTCQEIPSELSDLAWLGGGAVKHVHLGKWKGRHVAVSTLANSDYKPDFLHHLDMLQKLSPSPFVVQIVGFCEDILVTEFHPQNSALAVHRYRPSLSVQLRLCFSYVQVLAFLHNSPIGTRVMCDSNTLEKTLSQFLLTEDFRLVANDLDALPEVKPGQGIKCGHRQLGGSFVAPEQIWPFDDLPFVDDQMPSYNEKTDIWKVPDVCKYFLRDEKSLQVRQKLQNIHHLCKNEDPSLRPSAKELADFYKDVLTNLTSDSNH